MKTLSLAVAFLALAVSFACASPLTDYSVLGEFVLQQTGNEITGNYTLNQTDSNNLYLVVNPMDQQTTGTVQLDESNLTGDFQLVEQGSTEQFQLIETGNEIAGTFTFADQGTPLSGSYQLAVQNPEPGTFVLGAAGVVCLVLRRRTLLALPSNLHQ